MMRDQRGRAEPIAVVGMALRVPGANTPQQFWRNIVKGKDSLTRPSIDELRSAGVSRRQLADPNFVRSSPLLTDIEYFDARFFSMAGFEAERTEPAHRLFLECVWEAMEAAGIVPGRTGPVIGVFGGVEGSYKDEKLSHLRDRPIKGAIQVADRGKGLPEQLGNSIDFFSTRISHKLDLTGPSFTVRAACATSLVALHLAVQSMRRRECEVAVVGGASVLMPHVGAYISSVEGMLSKSGRIRSFDAGADGTVFGSGVGAVVLRPLKDALADSNPIWGIVRGSGVSNDGNPVGKESFIAPSREGQMAAVEAAMSDAQIAAESIGYLEAHGTATLLGDPVEVASITEVYRRETSATGYCALGSVKGNVGHLRTAAGVISFIKACLALKHRTLPPVANFTEHNPQIDFDTSPFFVNAEPQAWGEGPHPRRAAVSSFGFGGTNAHAIVEEYVGTPAPASSRPHHLLTLSAKSEPALSRRMADLAACLDENHGLATADVAHTLQCGREAMPHRACVYVEEGTTKPSTMLRLTPKASGVADRGNRPVVFLFPGQGAQRPGMGQQVYAREPVYRETIDCCAALLEPELGFDIRTLIHPESGLDGGGEVLRQTANAQPALFVVGYALARQFMSWGVRPEVMLGHSIGEIVAACVADVFSLEDALTLVAARARLMQACEPGAMVAVFLAETALEEALGEDLEIAALNAPNISVVSGAEANIDRFLGQMEKAGVGTRRIETSHAFHSRMMEPALPAFREVLRGIELRAPKIPVISNTTGVALTEDQAKDPEYWSHHLRHTVRLSSGAEHLLNNAERVFLELGPGRTLCDLIRQHDSEAAVFAALEDGASEASPDEQHSALFALGRLWCAGGAVDWQDFYGEEPRQKLALPTYPFERRRYWIEPGNFETKAEEGLYLYEPGWRLAELEHDETGDDGRPWLIFRDEHGLGLAVAETLKAQGRPVISLIPGDAFAETDAGTFAVRPGSKDDLEAALVKALARDSGLAPQVLHLWSVTGRSGEHNTIEAFRQSNRTGFYTLIALTQAAYDLGMIESLDIMVVADGLRQIDGEDNPLHAEKGGLLGPVRNVAKELPSMSFRCVDISGFEDGQSKDELCSTVIAEAMGRDQQHTICLRPQGRYVEELYPFTAPPLGRLRLRDGGTVLITGGMGGLGLKIAGALYDAAQARLVLTSRWEPPPREQWRARAKENDKVARALRELVALEERGAELLIVTADTGDIDSLKAAITEAESHFGTINGVVHAAGILHDGLLLYTTPELAEPQFQAKVHGAFNLDEIFAQSSLDFFVHFSSAASYDPGPGQAIYTASNNVLDILSRRRSLTQPGLNCAIGWGVWQEIGMAVVAVERRVRKSKRPSRHDHDQRVDRVIDHPLLQSRHQDNNGSTVYRSTMHDGDHWICEHRFKGRALIAGVTILEYLRASYVDLLGAETSIEFSKIAFVRPMFVHDQGIEIEIEYTPDGERRRFEVRSRALGSRHDWTVNTIGLAAPSGPPSADSVTVPDDILDAEPAHILLAHVLPPGIAKGPRWDCIVGVKIDGDTMWSQVRLGEDFRSDLGSFGLHPATFDRALNYPHKLCGTIGVPYTLDRIRIHNRLGAEFFARSTRRAAGAFDALYVDGDGNILVETEGFVTREVEGSSLGASADAADDDSKVPGAGLAANQRITVTQPGNLDSLRPCEFELRTPGAGEVKIDVVASGLNFRDVLSALGQLPMNGDSDPRIGGECSGIVSAVGPGVVDIRPGDPVLALANNAFAGSVTMHADLVMPVPHRICMEDAAGIPIAFLTADYAINTLAGLKKGERILIHAAAGGVGLAAVQTAQNIGAEIFATAGHPDKRRYLESLGVENLMDSRSLNFVQEIRDRTRGEGVDVVLNSLAGDYIPAGLGLLRYKGRFLEIGKRDILSDSKIGLSPFQNNLAYYAIDLGPMIQRRDPLLVDLFDSLMLRFARGDLRPIPTTVMPINNITGAMQRMARAEHIGKIVLKVRDDADPWRSIFKKFQDRYGRGVQVTKGLDTFRRLLSGNRVPHYVMALGKKIDEVGQVEHKVGSRENTRPNLATAYRAPTSAEEETLVSIWERALGVAPIGIDDDFFDLGGDSVTAIQTQFSVVDEYGITLSSTAFFNYPTIASLVEEIRTNDSSLTPATRPQPDHG